MAVLLTPAADASAAWPTGVRVATSLATSSPNPIRPVGVAIRNWGPLDQVFIAVEMQTDDANFQFIEVDSELQGYTCSNNDGCASSTWINTLGIGSTIYGRNVAHTSLAVRKLGPSQPVHVMAALRQKIELDCDGDASNYLADPIDEYDNLDIGAKLFSTTAGEIESWEIDANDGFGSCENHGVSFSRFVTGSLDPMACYTRKSHHPTGSSPLRDRLTFNTYDGSPSGTGAAWDNREVMFNDGEPEDHPGFDVYGSADHLALAGTWRGATQEIRVHFPDADLAPPDEDIVAFPSTVTGGKVDYAHVEKSGGELHLVWTDRTGDNASVRYQSCDFAFGSGDYCEDATQWLTSPDIVADSTTGYHRDAQGTVFAQDGDRQFVAWQYDEDDGPGERWRVVVADRCVGDASWNYEEVKPIDSAFHDQYVLIARPPLVLNRAENIAHIVFIEGKGYTGGFTGIENLTDSEAWWYRTEYEDCR